MEEADGEDEGSPFVVWLDLLEEVLVDHGVESSGETSLKTHWWLSRDLNGHLEETKWELLVWFTSDPESEVLMDFLVFWIKDVFHLRHEFETQMAVVEHDPLSGSKSLLDELETWDFLLFSHGDLTSWELSLLLGILINWSSWIGTKRKQVKYWLVES